MNFLAVALMWMAMQRGPTQHKFYITGYANDCDNPAVVAYGKDRVWALLNAKFPVAADLSHATVWTESEYVDMQNRIGKEFDAECKLAREATTITAVKIRIGSAWDKCDGLIVIDAIGYYCAMPLPAQSRVALMWEE